MRQNNIINCFWTGGFDSSFRILQLVLIKKVQVQPYYILDHKRKSTQLEIKAMEAIKEPLYLKSSEVKELLLPIKFFERAKIKMNTKLTKQYSKIASKIHIGIQYEWLSRFARQMKLHDVEVCFIKPPDGHAPDLYKIMKPDTTGFDHACRIRIKPVEKNLVFMKYFRFPLYHLKKTDLKELARRFGFLDILAHTWFCHKPDENNRPCGSCLPCKIAERSGYRVGLGH